MASNSVEKAGVVERGVRRVGRFTLGRIEKAGDLVRFFGGAVYLLFDAITWLFRGVYQRDARVARHHFSAQMVRVGIRSIPIVVLVQTFIGVILALQMAPVLRSYGQLERVADIVSIAMFRELGALLTGVVFSGFAGASIAAELGTMVEGEEIKALRAIALNPIRFLVVPRLVATIIMLALLTVVADAVGVLGGLITSRFVLNVPTDTYLNYTQAAVFPSDFISGIVKAGVFGLMILIIAAYEGLNARGGAEGVGLATTNTVVKSIVALISADVVFTAIFYVYGI
ncbi:MAG: ABC transporter permease [Phycisphaerales bacterium]|nr:ABC transporter permease [Phycisphaerales bacterium]